MDTNTLTELNDCGCCEGLTGETPLAIDNRPGLSAIAYRVGTHSRFKASMLARLSDSDLSALKALMTRDDDDFSIALLDAWASVADVLTFYQERIATESYLRTATERNSILQLARLIGYRLRPGVAASVYLAFTLEEAQGAPKRATLPIGTKVQSVPGPSEQPQTFETIEQIDARAESNALKPRTTELIIPRAGSTEVCLKGVATNLKPGDGLLFIGSERENNPGSDNWDYRTVASVTPNNAAGFTRVTWSEGLGSQFAAPAAAPKVYALRQRAALFGYNAPDWRAMPDSVKNGFLGRGPTPSDIEWPRFNISYNQPAANTDTIYLDAIYSKIVQGSWLVLVTPTYVEVYGVESIVDDSRSDFTLSAKTSKVRLSGENLNEQFSTHLRDTVVLGQSELLDIAERPLTSFDANAPSAALTLDERTLAPVEGSQIALAQFITGFGSGRALIVSGKLMRVKIVTAPTASEMAPDQSWQAFSANAGDSLQVIESPELQPDGRVRLHLRDKNGFTGLVTTNPANVLLTPALKDDALVSENLTLQSVNGTGTLLRLSPGLTNSYDRATVVICANVALATDGETKTEVLGTGDASQPYQQFVLKQPPLTYIGGPTPSGAESTLKIYVNDVQWHEQPMLYGAGARDRIFVTQLSDDGKTTIEFGDGQSGARLPTGRENIKATYRQGIGTGGNVKAGQLSLLMAAPLGVKSVTNPQAASGGADSEKLEDTRQNAPITVLTLDRVVSLSDYEDFARAFAGIAKALATWTWDGQTRGVFVTVAGPSGAEIADGSETLTYLISAMQDAGDPHVPLRVQTYVPAFFRLSALVDINPDYQQDKVTAVVTDALRAAFSFEARAFGQGIALSEIVAVMQAVPGVVAIDVTKLYRVGDADQWNGRLVSAMPQAGAEGSVQSAELLMLDPGPIDLAVM
jgi:Baseplate J-like protein